MMPRAIVIGVAVLAVAGCSGSNAPGGPAPEAPGEPVTLTLEASAGRGGDLVYLPFEVPEGVRRIEARFLDDTPQSVGLGVFDARGTDFLGEGFRGIAGEERREFFIEGGDATLGFIPGPMPPGAWTLVVPNYLVRGTIRAEVTMRFGEQVQPPTLQPVPERINGEAGWYRGDLHVHTEHSSDAFNSGAALSPTAMAERARGRGLDFIALTDHNVATQNARMPAAQPDDFLLLGGGEITTWLAGPGHLVVVGLQSGEFVDWRFRAVDGVWAKPQSRWGPDEQPIQALLDYARGRDIYTSAAHPFVAPGFGSNWGFFADSDRDPAALPDALEIWNDDFFITGGTATLIRWDTELSRGRRLCGNGGSDLHGVDRGIEVGAPTTVVYATALSREAIVDALQACRSYITMQPDGPALLLTATGPGGQQVMMGDTIIGGAGDSAEVTVRVLGGAGKRLILTRGNVPVLARTVETDDARFTRTIQLFPRGAVRAELWPDALSAPVGVNPLAFSNPIFFGPEPPLPMRAPLSDAQREHAVATLSTTPRDPPEPAP